MEKEIKVIEAYKTKDDKIFTDKKEAEKHGLELEVKSSLTEMVENELFNGMDKDTVVNFILDNRSKLFSLLSKRIM
jgi:dsDNA-binding SOS-regulon protein